MNVRIKTDKGAIVIELYPDKAPETVANFITYVKDGFYDGTIFHRVINGFMIQGGGFEPGMSQKETLAAIKNEADNGLSNQNGTVAMARTSEPNSATSQFFINVKDNNFLDFVAPAGQGWGYCVFGKVIEGMDIIDTIKTVATTSKAGHQDVPIDDIMLEQAEIVEE